VCAAPRAAPAEAVLFFFVYSLLTAFVIISLFIGVVAMGMLEAMDDNKQRSAQSEYEAKLAKNEQSYVRSSSDLRPNNPSAVAPAPSAPAAEPQSNNPTAFAKLDAAFGCERERAPADRCAPWYLDLAEYAAALSKTTWFSALVVGAILVVAVSVGVQTDYASSTATLGVVDLCVQVRPPTKPVKRLFSSVRKLTPVVVECPP
jgi:hypothetical protein